MVEKISNIGKSLNRNEFIKRAQILKGFFGNPLIKSAFSRFFEDDRKTKQLKNLQINITTVFWSGSAAIKRVLRIAEKLSNEEVVNHANRSIRQYYDHIKAKGFAPGDLPEMGEEAPTAIKFLHIRLNGFFDFFHYLIAHAGNITFIHEVMLEGPVTKKDYKSFEESFLATYTFLKAIRILSETQMEDSK